MSYMRALVLSEIDALRQEYLQITNHTLPSIAKARGFPVSLNHCFWRIILDNLFNGCWFDFLTVGKVSAYKQLDENQLKQAIAIAQSIVDGDSKVIATLNHQSLEWRRSRLDK